MRTVVGCGSIRLMKLEQLCAGLRHSRLEGRPAVREITDITNDSRRVVPGGLYAALPGMHVDGHRFIGEAIGRGAAAILCERTVDAGSGVAWLIADEARLALSELADRFYGEPSRSIFVVGVTGTDGKTSTVSFVHQLLGSLAGPSAFLSTAAVQVGASEEPNLLHQSTPEAPEVHRTLRHMIDAGARYAVLESTSHGLSRKTCRLAHVRYGAAVFTNLSHEHLEFHGTYERYRDDKAALFRSLCPRTGDGQVEPFGVVNGDDPEAGYFAAACAWPVLRYAIDAPCEFRAADLRLETAESCFALHTPGGRAVCRLPVPGRFNVSNALAAAATVAGICGSTADELAAGIEQLRPVRGRMHVVQSAPFSVIVDYAHTPGSFESVLPFFRDHCDGRLIVVFGSAGERDVAKRPLQGRIADRYADLIVLADEDPRGEDRRGILEQIAAGCPHRSEGDDILIIPDRREAIGRAVAIARPADTVLLLGKGHETTIIGPERAEPWDEITVAEEELASAGYQ